MPVTGRAPLRAVSPDGNPAQLLHRRPRQLPAIKETPDGHPTTPPRRDEPVPYALTAEGEEAAAAAAEPEAEAEPYAGEADRGRSNGSYTTAPGPSQRTPTKGDRTWKSLTASRPAASSAER